MLKIERNGQDWQVLEAGVVVFTGTMLEARAEYSRRMREQLNSKPQTRRGGKRIFR